MVTTTIIMDKEQWKKIKNIEGYQISNFGSLKSYKKKIPFIMKLKVDGNGYQSVLLTLSKNVTKRFRVHRLVAENFVSRKLSKNEVNHIDGNKTNNYFKNLKWVNRSENNKHAYLSGLRTPSPSYGENHGLSKLKNSQIPKIRQMYKETNFSCREVGELFKVSGNVINKIVRKINYKNI